MLTLGHLKEKENACGDDMFLAARVIVLGQDDDGDDITSLVLDETTERPGRARREWKGAIKASDQAALRELVRLWISDSRQPVHTVIWRKAVHTAGLLKVGEAEDSDANRRGFQRMVSLLRGAGMIEQTGKARAAAYSPAVPGIEVVQ